MLGLYGKYFYIVHTISRVVKSESLQQCSIIKKTAAVKKGITVVEESESHRYRSTVHSHVVETGLLET